MIKTTLKEIAEAANGTIISGDPGLEINNITIDSREVKKGDLFLALVGANKDGHDYINQALRAQAAAIVIAPCLPAGRRSEATKQSKRLPRSFQSLAMTNVSIIKVDDTLLALQKIAYLNREKSNAKVVGITGSSGKTTTKDMLTSILKEQFKVVSSKLNYNNEIGVPLTLLEAGIDTDIIIVEMAMRAMGEIKQLCKIAKPDLGLITNIGLSHFSNLGSKENIAKAKGELVESIPEHGVVFLNSDDEWFKYLSSLSKAKVLPYALNTKHLVGVDGIRINENGLPEFNLFLNDNILKLKLPVAGKHNIYNAVGAASVALWLGANNDNIIKGLCNALITAGRSEVFKIGGITIINDTYNANPVSMKASLDILAGYTKARKVAVLGDMLELGDIADESHLEVGKKVSQIKADLLITIGTLSRKIAQGAINDGFAKNAVFSFNNIDQAYGLLKNQIKPGDVVLVKASRALALNKVVDYIVEMENECV